jgi:hypothetical protein
MAKKSWGHTPNYCCFCKKVGPRMKTDRGLAHKRCIKEHEEFILAKRPITSNAKLSRPLERSGSGSA